MIKTLANKVNPGTYGVRVRIAILLSSGNRPMHLKSTDLSKVRP
jgi:hypothetical protein